MATYRGNNCDRWIKRQEPKHERGKQKSTIEICKAITSYGCHRDNAYKRHSPRVHCYHHLVWQFTYTHQRHTYGSALISHRIISYTHKHTHIPNNEYAYSCGWMFVNAPNKREWDERNRIRMDFIFHLSSVLSSSAGSCWRQSLQRMRMISCSLPLFYIHIYSFFLFWQFSFIEK